MLMCLPSQSPFAHKTERPLFPKSFAAAPRRILTSALTMDDLLKLVRTYRMTAGLA